MCNGARQTRLLLLQQTGSIRSQVEYNEHLFVLLVGNEFFKEKRKNDMKIFLFEFNLCIILKTQINICFIYFLKLNSIKLLHGIERSQSICI